MLPIPQPALPPTHAVVFSHPSDGVLVPDSPVLSPLHDLTLEAWIKPEPDDAASFHFIISKNYGGTGYDLLLIGKGDQYRIQFEANETVSYPISMATLKDHWWHVAGVFKEGEGLSLFLNGNKVAEKKSAAKLKPNNLVLYIGTSEWEWFRGQIGNVAIWSEARTRQQIRRDGIGRPSGARLIAFWDFAHRSADTLFDSTHHTRPALLLGGAKIVRLPKEKIQEKFP